MITPIAPRWLACLCVMPWLAACSTQPTRVVTQPEVITVTRDRYVPVPDTYTAPIPAPAPPPQRCQRDGKPAWCVLDVIVWIEAWRGKLAQANADRATLGTLSGAEVTP